MDFDAIALMVIGTLISTTKEQVNEQIDKAAAKVVEAVKNSETKIDDTVVKDLLAPALRRMADKVTEGLSA